MPAEEEDIVQHLLNEGYTRQQVHSAMHKWVLQHGRQVLRQQQLQQTFTGRWQLRCKQLLHFITGTQLTGKALSLLNSQFAKKPKNPV